MIYPIWSNKAAYIVYSDCYPLAIFDTTLGLVANSREALSTIWREKGYDAVSLPYMAELLWYVLIVKL